MLNIATVTDTVAVLVDIAEKAVERPSPLRNAIRFSDVVTGSLNCNGKAIIILHSKHW